MVGIGIVGMGFMGMIHYLAAGRAQGARKSDTHRFAVGRTACDAWPPQRCRRADVPCGDLRI